MALIPTGNPMALVGYYLGVGSLIPIFGLLLSPFAIICGIVGVVKANSNPQAAGMGHAITAIVLGLFGQLIWIGLYFVMVAAGVLR